MTPASSDRYQSRLFRFIHKQSRRFTQQCDRAWRNLQSTASWVAAVGLYPLYLLFQSSRSTANQVGQAVEQTLRQLPAEDEDTPVPAVDTPIQQVLLYVTGVGESQNSKFKIQNLLTTHYSPLTTHSIRGIASQLSSQNLVLVTAQNQTLDVLDPQQQQALQAEIITAVAEYWRARISRSNQSLAPSPQSLAPHSWLTSLDQTVAEVESHHLVQVKSAAIALYQRINLSQFDRVRSQVRIEESTKSHTTRILSLIWAAIDYFFGTDNRPSVSSASGENHNRVKPHLAGRAIATNSRFPATTRRSQLPANNNPADNDLEDPWLTARDLFGTVAVETTGDRSTPAFALPADPVADCVLPQDRDAGLRQFLSRTKKPKGIVKKQQTAKGIAKRHRTTEDPPNPPYKGGQQSTPQISRLQKRAGNFPNPPDRGGQGGIGSKAQTDKITVTTQGKIGRQGKLSPQAAQTGNISPLANKNSSVQSTPDWIETPATLMGYVKHPLEQILTWLDRAMLWLEEKLLNFWQWLQKMWRKF